jgi:hypothetical protein
MTWIVELLNDRVRQEIEELPLDMKPGLAGLSN